MVRKTFRWLAILIAVVGVAGGAAAWYAWVKSDAIVRDELQARLSTIAPSCDLQLGRVRFDWNRTITVRDFAVRAKGKDVPPTLVVPEVEIRIDRERFVNDQMVDVQSIKLVRPRFDLTRRSDGTWSIEDLAPFRLDPSIPVPEWKIEDATVRVCLEQENSDPVVLTLQDAKLQLVPAGRRQLIIRGLSDVADAGPLQVSGKLNLDAGHVTWSLEGSVAGLNTSGNIAGFALRSSANLRQRVADLGRKLQQAEETLLADDDESPEISPNVPFRTVSRSAATTPPWARSDASATANDASRTVANGDAGAARAAEPSDLTGLGVNAVIDIKFAVSKPDPARSPSYQVWLDCRDGQVVNTLLPFALRHLRGQLYWDNASLRMTEFRADGNGTSLRVDAALRLDGPEPAGTIDVAINDLQVSDRYPGKLPPAVERFLQIVHPSGPVDLAGTFEQEGGAGWKVRAFKATAKGATAVPSPFPYPIQDIAGVLEQTAPDRLEARMTGKAGVRPISLNAVIQNPGPEAEVVVEIAAPSVIVDEGVREAFKPEVRSVLNRLGLEGIAENLQVHLFRPAGFGQKYSWRVTTDVRDGEIEYDGFPYRIKQLRGHVDYQSDNQTLTLWNVTGVHDRALLSMKEGTYRKPPATPASPLPGTPPFGLSLPIVAEKVTLGGDLRAAVPPALRSVWDDLQPGGLADLEVKIRWLPGYAPDIRLPKLNIVNGSLRPKAFPYPLDTISANLKYVPGRLDIVDFAGWHADGTRVATRDSSFSFEPNDEWLLSLANLSADDLRLGGDFRRASPAGLRHAIELLDVRGPEGRSPIKELRGRIDLRGSRRSSALSAGWNLTAELIDATADAGVEIVGANGAVTCQGTFLSDGGSPSFSGNVALRSAEVFGQRLENIRGPFSFRNGQIEIGTRDALAGGLEQPSDPNGLATDRRLTADCLGEGLLTLDTLLTLGEVPRYIGRATLTGGRIEHLAQTAGDGGIRNVSGVMNGWLNFTGEGTDPAGLIGRGRVRIEPAALYQLPVIMQTFQQLTTLAPPGALDNTAFRFAQADFQIRNRGFEASLWPSPGITLAGDALKLVGGGRVEFDGRLQLEFQTKLPQNPVGVVPVVGRVVGRLLDVATTGWYSVVVTGTTDSPLVSGVPLKAPADSVRQIFEAFGPPRTATGLRR